MDDRTLVRTGLVGAAIAAVCCATPILVIALAALGLVGAAVWLDWLLIPALIGFVMIASVGLYRLRDRPLARPSASDDKKVTTR